MSNPLIYAGGMKNRNHAKLIQTAEENPELVGTTEDEIGASCGTLFLDVFPIHWPADLGPIEPETFSRCGFGGAVTLDLGTGLISLFDTHDLKRLCQKLRNAKLVGFNCMAFDRSIITGAGGQVGEVRWLDLMAMQPEPRCSLAELVELNFGIRKHFTLEQHREHLMQRDQRWLFEKAINAVHQMSRLFTQLN